MPVASIREGLEIFAGELEAVIRELPELEGQRRHRRSPEVITRT
jgi:hypothetical protein